jgi:hypothetical protein
VKNRKTKPIKEKKKNLQKYLRKIQADYLSRKQKVELYNQLFQEQNSFSKTDIEATFPSWE